MQTDMNRIKTLIEQLAEYNDTPGHGVSRFSYSPQDEKARAYITDLCKELGLEIRVDAVGNIFARLQGKDPSLPPIMTGSHIDSVKHGGKFDGMAGAVCSLEAVRVMVEGGYEPQCPIDLVFFAEEEGSNFKIPAFGSQLLAGILGIDDLKTITADNGLTAYELIRQAGYRPADLPQEVLKKGDVRAMIELHIEQSVRLEREGVPIGIVSGIAGLRWFEVRFEGQANHAGATPMHLRADPMAAASQVIAQVKHMAPKAGPTAVATVGKLDVLPNIANVIPSQVRFVVDIRDVQQSAIDQVSAQLKEAVEQAAADNGLSYEIIPVTSNDCITIPAYLTKALEDSAKRLGLDYIFMPSGAVHDASSLADICDVAMLFVPSIGGRSHVPEESTKYEDLKAGADVLLLTLLQLTAS